METPYDPDARIGQRGFLSAGYKSPHGKPEGLAQRLDQIADTLATDKSVPWFGMGLFEDIRLAAQLLRKPAALVQYDL